jgi:spermidine synthase
MAGSGSMGRHLTAIGAAGWASTVAQILMLREIFVQFYGNELSVGIVLFFWLLWTAAGSALAPRLFGKFPAASPSCQWRSLIPGLLSAYALALPMTVIWIRGARLLFDIPRGDVPGLGQTILLTGATTAPLCLLFGFLFGSIWMAAADSTPKGRSGLWIYAAEAAGAGIGGLTFYFLLLPRCTALEAAILSGWVPALAALITMRRPAGIGPTVAMAVAWMMLASLWAAGARLESWSRSWVWGSGLVRSVDTPYHNITVLQGQGQQSVMIDGLWAYSIPDPQGAEDAVHLVLLQHGHPQKVLVLGAAGPEILRELLRYPDLRRIQVVDPDPVLLSMSRLDREDPTVDFDCDDIRRYVHRAEDCYDVVLLNTADPVTLALNRFRTVEFFRDLDGLLCSDGVVSVTVSGGEEMLGEAQIRLVSSVLGALDHVFGDRVLYPGSRIRLVAARNPGTLARDPEILAGRAERRGLALQYVRRDRLENLLDPLRQAYFDQVVAAAPPELNRDGHPVGFLYALGWWTARTEGGASGDWIGPMTSPAFRKIGAAVVSAVAVLLMGWLVFGPRLPVGRGAALAVFSVGASLMVLQIVLFLAYQISEGALYTAMALLVTSFMTGLSAGALAAHCFVDKPGGWARAKQALLVAHVGLAALALALGCTFGRGAPSWIAFPSRLWALVFFCAAAGGMGLLGGAHFGLSCLVCRTRPGESAAGPRLYAWDLAGAASAAMGGTLILIPIWGLSGAGWACAGFLAVTFAALLRSLRLR